MVAAFLALSMLIAAGWSATFTKHNVNSFEREHLEAATQFLRDRELATASLPDEAEFQQWAREMDSKGYHRFDGRGYTLNKRCGSKASDFCLQFWTGDEFVTYRSWQGSMEEVHLDESSIPLAISLLFLSMIAATGSKMLLFPRVRMLDAGVHSLSSSRRV
jgi:hypothetical protein